MRNVLSHDNSNIHSRTLLDKLDGCSLFQHEMADVADCETLLMVENGPHFLILFGTILICFL
jgi:hypothetical protein